jgi:PPM family protein phosphatase
MTLALRYAVRSDVGLLREGNEDSAYAGPRVLAVADGMGGHAAGEVASAVTIGAMAELDAERPGPSSDMLADLSNAVAAANMRLQQMIMANPAVEGMGTTLTAVLWSDGHAAVCHIGDSRGYLLRDGELYQITHDHTLVQSLVDEGRITEDDVSTHPQRSLLLRALDGRTVAEPDLSMHDSRVGDRYLLCSDGLSGVVSDETLRETLASIPDPEAVTRQLIDLAIRGGGPDNITCIVADVVEIGTTRLPPPKPVLAGAATNGTDPRIAPPGTGPFAAFSQQQRTRTVPQPVLTEDGMTGMHGVITANGTAEHDASLEDGIEPQPRRGHRGPRRRRSRADARTEGGRRRWPIVTTSLVVLLVVIVVGGYLAYQYSQDQYYVATDPGGEVVIYQGINQSVAGISLSHPHTYTQIMAGQVPQQYRQQLAGAPSASSLAGANQIVATIRTQVNTCKQYYTKLRQWQLAEARYQNELATADKARHSTKGIPKPGPQPSTPSLGCPTPTAYGIILPDTP